MTIGRLADLHDYKVPETMADVRGWRVYDVQGVHTGIIEDLIVDTTTGEAQRAILHFEGSDHEIPFEQLTLDRRERQIHVPYTAATLRAMPTVPGWHPVDRHNVRATFLPDLAGVDDWGGEVEIEDLRKDTRRPI